MDGNFDSLSSSEEEMPVEFKQKSKRAARAEKRSADRAVRAETRQIRAKKAKFGEVLPELQEQPPCLMSDIIVDDQEEFETARNLETDSNYPTGKFVAVEPKGGQEPETVTVAQTTNEEALNTSETTEQGHSAKVKLHLIPITVKSII